MISLFIRRRLRKIFQIPIRLNEKIRGGHPRVLPAGAAAHPCALRMESTCQKRLKVYFQVKMTPKKIPIMPNSQSERPSGVTSLHSTIRCAATKCANGNDAAKRGRFLILSTHSPHILPPEKNPPNPPRSPMRPITTRPGSRLTNRKFFLRICVPAGPSRRSAPSALNLKP
jgi:hypothetical protein